MSTVPRPVASAACAPAAAGRALRILFADDLHELRDVAQNSFSREGHRIVCVADGELALSHLEADAHFDLLITDHHMPNMNGLELVTRLRQLRFPGKIMVFSSELSEGIAAQYRAQRVDRILYKPVFPSILRQTLNDVFPPPAPAA